MALFPKIDQPCPLGIDEQKRIAGYCGRCERNVHALDAMSDTERVALLRGACDSICVSYRIPVRRAPVVGLGAALVLSVAAPAFATDALPLGHPPAAEQRSIDATPASPLGMADSSGPKCDEANKAATADSDSANSQKLETITFTGGVRRPQDADWVDDSTLADLPMVQAPR